MRDPAADPVPAVAGPTRSAPPARHPAIRDTPRGIARRRARHARGPQARRRPPRDRALPLLGYAAALRRSELAAVEREHLRFTADGLELLLLAATAAAAAWCGAAPPGYRDAAPVPALAG